MPIRATLTLALAAVTVFCASAVPAIAQAGNGHQGGLRPLPRPTPTPGPGGRHTAPVPSQPAQSGYDAVSDQAIREARSALDQYRDFESDYRRARTAQDRASIVGYMEQATANALQRIANLVADTRRDDPATRVRIYQVARDALGSGNRSGDPAERIRYNVNALRAISVLNP
jgi:hypothetical protein